MTNPANDIVKQASQGSVAAIIQVLNDKLADSGVRTRAILADGVLQLLCEAPTVEQLEPATLSEQIQRILEPLAPRNIRRVNINSRIVREQQLLWLEEIHRDPENQLLWSKEITLKKPNPLKQFWKEWQSRKPETNQTNLPKVSPRQLREQRQFWRGGLIGGTTVGLLLLGGWAAYSRLSSNSEQSTQAKPNQPLFNPAANQVTAPIVPRPAQSPPAESKVAAKPVAPSGPLDQPFVNAVRLAERASQQGQTAKSSAEWLELAARWQQAADLMASVPSTDDRYQTAQDRVTAYRKNSESALQKAQQQQQ